MPKKIVKQEDINVTDAQAQVAPKEAHAKEAHAKEVQPKGKGKKAQPKEADAKEAQPKAENAPVDNVAPKQAQPKGKGKKAPVEQAPVEQADTQADSEADDARASRQTPTRDSVEKEFDDVITSLDEEIEKLRDQTAKSKGVKFLRTLNKRLKTLKNHALRVSKQRASTRRNNTNSGFLKPVQISKDLAKFTGWNPSDLRSRVDVTKFICNYIRENNLQDPNDRRRIRVEDDQNLKKLLKFEESADKPLTYYSLQTYLKGHFTPVEGETKASEAKPADAHATKASEAKPKKAVAGKQ
jgi:chromatin remodeling complex protein RSC6